MSAPPPKLSPYRASLAGTLLAAREAVMAPIRPILREANVTEQQWRVLRVLAETDTLDARGIATAALLHAPSVTRILKELEDRGLIKRSIDPKDSRRSLIAISAAGRRLMQITARYTMRVLADYTDAFGSERLAALQSELIDFTKTIGQFMPVE